MPLSIPVLLVEDTEWGAALMRDALRGALPIAITHVQTLAEALDVLPGDFELVLLDLGLPDTASPIDTVRAVARVHSSIVVMTSGGTELELDCIREGADDFLIKGMPRATVRRTVQRALERRFRDKAKQ